MVPPKNAFLSLRLPIFGSSHYQCFLYFGIAPLKRCLRKAVKKMCGRQECQLFMICAFNMYYPFQTCRFQDVLNVKKLRHGGSTLGKVTRHPIKFFWSEILSVQGVYCAVRTIKQEICLCIFVARIHFYVFKVVQNVTSYIGNGHIC